MKSRTSPRKNLALDLGLAGIVLGILLLFTYNYFVKVPYLGFEVSTPSGEISYIYASWEPTGSSDSAFFQYRIFQESPLQLGDVLLSIDDVKIADRIEQRMAVFPPLARGEQIDLTILRAGQPVKVLWTVPGPNWPEMFRRSVSYWYLAYIFWGIGLMSALLIRPRDLRWQMLVAFNYIWAIWMIAGTASFANIWNSGVVLRSASWLLVPVALLLHWHFPLPLTNLSPAFRRFVFLVAFGFVLAELLHLLPQNLYLVAVALVFIGGLLLTIAQFIRNPNKRSYFSLIFFSEIILLIVVLLTSLFNYQQGSSGLAAVLILFLPILPLSYFYAIYSRQLGGMEIRFNRLIGLLTFFALVFVPAIPFFAVARLWIPDPDLFLVLSALVAFLATLAGVLIYPRYQKWFEVRILRAPQKPEWLVSHVASRLAASLEYKDLVDLLQREVFPSLLVRQAVLLRWLSGDGQGTDKSFQEILVMGVPDDELPQQDELAELVEMTQNSIQRISENGSGLNCCPWIHLVLPLNIEGQLIGLCLFGRRDPDDYYSSDELPLFQAIIDQIALGLIHIEQTSRLRIFLQADIQRQEQERSRLALELHDQVLGQMAVLAQGMNGLSKSEDYNRAYMQSVQHLRSLIAGLRPAPLNFGLKAGLEDLADLFTEQQSGSRDFPQFRLNFSGDSHGSLESKTIPRYPDRVELQLYRIVQQACQNALMHAQARTITIVGRFYRDSVELIVQDDGKGFKRQSALDLEALLSEKHYGLVGMYERAALIQAELFIDSTPNKGTRVLVAWRRSQKIKHSNLSENSRVRGAPESSQN